MKNGGRGTPSRGSEKIFRPTRGSGGVSPFPLAFELARGDTMTESEILSAFQACNASCVSDRHCEVCPLHMEHDCHVALCSLAIDLILRNRAKNERMVHDINYLQATLDEMTHHLIGD